MTVHRRLNKAFLVWIVDADFKVEGSFGWSLTHDLRLRLLKQYLKMALLFWFEFNNIVLLVVDDIHVCNVEVARAEFAHKLCPVKAVWVVDPAAFFVED